jgi:hypothetical protein
MKKAAQHDHRSSARIRGEVLGGVDGVVSKPRCPDREEVGRFLGDSEPQRHHKGEHGQASWRQPGAGSARFKDLETQPCDQPSGVEVHQVVGAKQMSSPVVQRSGKGGDRQDKDEPHHTRPGRQPEARRRSTARKNNTANGTQMTVNSPGRKPWPT